MEIKQEVYKMNINKLLQSIKQRQSFYNALAWSNQKHYGNYLPSGIKQ
jgi:hypothetical protein